MIKINSLRNDSGANLSYHCAEKEKPVTRCALSDPDVVAPYV